MDDKSKISLALTGVPETLLWTLYYRAQEAERPDSVLPDPLAVELVRRIDYPFAERLGAGALRGQWQGLRARTFDEAIARFLTAHPGGTVVALGEGLETQFWRVDDGRVHWLGVDLPEAATARAQILPGHERHRQLDVSVMDGAWMDEVDPARPVLITAQGLLMYLPRAQVHDLLARCARRFPGAQLLFDGVPRWTSAVTQKAAASKAAASKASADQAAAGQAAAGQAVTGKLMAPPMPWSMDHREAAALRSLPGIRSVERLHPPRGRGVLHAYALPLADRLPLLRSFVLSIWSVRFA